MSDDNAVVVNGLTKTFKLPHERSNSIKSALINIGKRDKGYEKQTVLENVSFEVKKGEFYGIVGRNGSGKSTLLKMLAGIYAPDKGTIRINGKLIPFIELGVGFNPELTGRENVFLNGALLGFNRKEMQAMYKDIVEFAELEKFMDQKLKNYSSGMQVRLAFSIAIRAQGDILLLDEVLAVGDEAFQRKCYEYFVQLKKNGQTVILVTHDMAAVERFCTRALMLEKSKVVSIGNPRTIALTYQRANSMPVSQPTELKRPENPPIFIERLHVVPKDGRLEYTMDDAVEFEVDINVRELHDIQLNLFFVRDDGSYVAGMNTTRDIPNLRPSKGKHTLNFHMAPGQLTKGKYQVNVGVYTHDNKLKMIDILDVSYGVDTPLITMVQHSPYQDGLFYLSGSWRKEK